jgi:hypothetical protein
VRSIELDDFLSADNVWTRRLLGLEPFQRTRDSELVEREYDRDLYGELLARYEADPAAFRRELSQSRAEEVVVSLGPKLVSVPLDEFKRLRAGSISEILDRYNGASGLCELGAGYGQNSIALGREIYGGEFSPAAVKLARRMGIEIVEFDFYDPGSYEFIRPGSVVMTSHAVEQIPDAKGVIEGLHRVRDRIDTVIHFEPMYRPKPVTLLDHLRNRYMELNDYCRNLLETIETEPGIEILEHQPDVFGLNALNPTSILAWRFR